VDSGQTAKEYSAYLKRALYYEAVGRTINGFVGAISRKPHVITLPEKMEIFEKDATVEGIGLAEFIKKLCAETLLIGRGGVLVDYDGDGVGGGTERSYLKVYCAETITNWGDDFVVLRETVYGPDPQDLLSQIEIDQIRQLHMLDGRYTVTIWRKSTGPTAQEWIINSQTQPTLRGAPIKALPFFWLSCMGRTSRIEKPPLLGLVNVAMSHYRSSADLEHGRHFTAMPTLWVTGTIAGAEPIRVGAGAVIELSDPGSRVGYAEFTGQGLGSLEKALSDKEHMMAVLGAAVFGGEKKGVEAAETARIRTAGENSLLMGAVSAVEETLEAALQCAADWMGVSGEIDVQINRDFIDQAIDSQTLMGMVAAYQAGAMSLEAFLYCLQQAEMLAPETDIATEVAKLSAAATKKAADAAKVAAAAKPTVVAAEPRASTLPGGQ
jgi:Domain of unknown function (DUF4055)